MGILHRGKIFNKMEYWVELMFAVLFLLLKVTTIKVVECILRPPIQPEIYGFKLNLVLKWRDNYIEIIRVVSLIAALKIEMVKSRGLKSQEPL